MLLFAHSLENFSFTVEYIIASVTIFAACLLELKKKHEDCKLHFYRPSILNRSILMRIQFYLLGIVAIFKPFLFSQFIQITFLLHLLLL